MRTVLVGGFKIWECSTDLIQFLAEHKFVFTNRLVFELGCGAGLPGIYALLHGATVHFQDYNEEVLHRVTIPTVAINVQKQQLPWPPFCRFFHGDWSSLASAVTSSTKYDYILTSETVYSAASYCKLHSVMEDLLQPDGEIYVAAKTCYFGVGGGSHDFAVYVQRRGIFNVEVVHCISSGVQREILRLTFKTCSRDVRDT